MVRLRTPGKISTISFDRFLELCPHPGRTDLLFYPTYWGLGTNPSSEEIADAVVNWRPRILAMTIVRVRRHRFRPDLSCYVVEVGQEIHTQVVGAKKYHVRDVCAVALSGVRLPDGKEIKHGFVDRAYSAGEILGLTDAPPGTELAVEGFPNKACMKTGHQ